LLGLALSPSLLAGLVRVSGVGGIWGRWRIERVEERRRWVE